jgi:hypothetical protein
MLGEETERGKVEKYCSVKINVFVVVANICYILPIRKAVVPKKEYH